MSGSTQLFHTNTTVNNISEFNQSNNGDGYDQPSVTSNVLMALQLPNNLTASMNTDRGEYNNYIQSDENDDFAIFG